MPKEVAGKMEARKLRFGLVGCGQVAVKHATALGRINQASLVSVCDKDESIARKFAERHSLKAYSDVTLMVKSEKLDVVCILTPTGEHIKNVLEIAPLGTHIVVEKPMALRLEDADTMINLCGQFGARLFVVHQNRFNLPIVKLREAVQQNRFGKFVLGTVRVRWTRPQDYYERQSWRGTWLYDGGVLTNQASHHIDMLEWMMGDVETVHAETATRLLKIETEDTGVAVLRFSSGALGIIEATVATRPKDLDGSISILGEKGSVVVGGFFMNRLDVWNFETPLPHDEEIRKKFAENPDVPAWNHEHYLKNVIDSINGGTQGLVEGPEGRKSLELINAIYESAETGKTVTLKFKPSKSKLGVGH